MVKFVTTAYTHMYGNSYTGRSKYGREKRTLVGHRVEKMRKDAGLGVRDVCRAVEVAPSIYDSFLEGGYRFDRDQLRRLADVLGVSVHDLFHAKENGSPKADDARKAKSTLQKIHVIRPIGHAKKAKPTTPARRRDDGTAKSKPYDADTAADLLAKKFRVTRAR